MDKGSPGSGVPAGFNELKVHVDSVTRMLRINYLEGEAIEFRKIMDDFNRYVELGPSGGRYIFRPGVVEIFQKICVAADKFGGKAEVDEFLRQLNNFEGRRWLD